MSQPHLAADPAAPALELKAGNFPLLSLKLGSLGAGELGAAVAAKIAQAPKFFQHAAVVIDLDAAEGLTDATTLAAILEVLRDGGLRPVAAHGGGESDRALASAAGLAVLSAAGRGESRPAPRVRGLKVISRAVRSGQQIHAAGADLVVMGAVSEGAEILADGHIHVHGVLRGRALAGLDGDTGARIICQRLQAELVSIAGVYRVLEEIEPALREAPAQVYLDDEQLCIEPVPAGAPN